MKKSKNNILKETAVSIWFVVSLILITGRPDVESVWALLAWAVFCIVNLACAAYCVKKIVKEDEDTAV